MARYALHLLYDQASEVTKKKFRVRCGFGVRCSSRLHIKNYYHAWKSRWLRLLLVRKHSIHQQTVKSIFTLAALHVCCRVDDIEETVHPWDLR